VTKRKTDQPERIPLDVFLDRLPPDQATEIREAARIMVANERSAARLRGVERDLRPFFIFGVVAFIIAMTLLLFFSEPGSYLDTIDGAWPLMIVGLGFLPSLLAYYAIRIRNRSAADLQNFDFNKRLFLPAGAIYFPSDSDESPQMVTLVEPDERHVRRSKYDQLKPGAIW